MRILLIVSLVGVAVVSAAVVVVDCQRALQTLFLLLITCTYHGGFNVDYLAEFGMLSLSIICFDTRLVGEKNVSKSSC